MRNKSEIEILLNELRNMKEEPKKVFSPKEVWDGIAEKKNYKQLGFASEEELKQFLNDNPYDY
jgi:hypothetical protein